MMKTEFFFDADGKPKVAVHVDAFNTLVRDARPNEIPAAPEPQAPVVVEAVVETPVDAPVKKTRKRKAR
jgi:hypothetical protein